MDTAPENPALNSSVKTSSPQNETSIIPQDGMKIYYDHYFPHEYFFLWLGKGDIEKFQRREFSFTLQNDAYLRFQSFASWQQFKNKLIYFLPKKIDIGAIYNVLPSEHKTAQKFIPEQKEIVFDIDMTDYDDIRTCCQDTKICSKCWKYMIVAYEILDKTLKEDFGYENLIYVFSGRRGIHCWLCDDKARECKDNVRNSIAKYIQYKVVNVKMDISQGLKEPLHPMYNRAIEIINKYFDIVIKEQNLLNVEKGKILLKGLINAYFMGTNYNMDNIDKILNCNEKPSDIKFKEVEEYLKNFENTTKKNIKNQNSNYSKTDLCLKDFKLNVMYPRLDINVSTHINHLLKSPFSIHPKTGLVSVPLTPDDIYNFKIENIPRIDQLVDDYKKNKENLVFNKFKNYFKEFVEKLNKKTINIKN